MSSLRPHVTGQFRDALVWTAKLTITKKNYTKTNHNTSKLGPIYENSYDELV